jgi:IS5 family transposase
LKQLRQFSYRTLASEIDITPIYRKFTRFYGASIPCFTTFERAIKAISAETMDSIHEEIVKLGIRKKVEKGKAIRHDTTVVGTDIAYPTDAKMLKDCVRVITRLAESLREAASGIRLVFSNHTRSAKKHAYRIAMAKGKHAEKTRAKSYKVLLKVQRKTRKEAEAMLEAVRSHSVVAMRIEVMGLIAEMQEVLNLAEQVYEQAERRVIRDEKVPVDEKLVSIFETHTDIICRGKKSSKTEFRHKVDFSTGRSGLVLRYEVFQGNPGDNEVLDRAIDDYIALFGQAPEKLTADRRYFSSDNERIAREKGVRQVALPKPGRLNELRKSLQNAPWFKKLLRWRAGVEGNLSTLLRSFGLKRCLWKGWESFKAYVGLSVITYNLRLLAGHLAKI